MRQLFYLLISLLLLVACGVPYIGETSEPASAVDLLSNYPSLPDNLVRAEVDKVVDGDTVDVRVDGQTVRLRLIGLNTPESVDPRRPVECFGQEASDRAKELLNGQEVLLEADPTQGEMDRYARALRYVWFPDGRLFNLEMIALGYAHEYTYNVPYRYQTIFQEAQEDARENQRGFWSATTCNGDTQQSAPPTPTPTPSNCDPAYPDICLPSPPPDLNCGDIPHRSFRVLPPDPHRLDGNGDGIACEGR